MHGTIRTILNFLIAVICVIIIISFAVSITVMFKPLYYFDIDYLEICETSGFPREKCVANYDALIDYNMIGGADKLVFPSLEMSKEGETHFKEVKDIFITMQLLAMVGIPLIFFGIVWEFRKNRNNLKENSREKTSSEGKWMGLVATVALAVVAVVLAAIIIDWQWAFETMHSIFFDNDYWIFNAVTDPVIKMLPDAFFMHCGIIILSITTVSVILMTIIYRMYKRKN